jgi:DNA-binding SARP family transcriptional activator/streptogramin lyase
MATNMRDVAKRTVKSGNGSVNAPPLTGEGTRLYGRSGRDMRYSILGPLEVRDGEDAIAVGGGQQRKLLAILLLHANEVVSSDRLIDELWGSNPPGTAVKALQGYVSQLRKRLGQATVDTVGSGYRLRVEPEQLDASRFEQLLAEARRLDQGAAATKLREALGLWRGPALADFAYDDFARTEVERLEELRQSCIERRIDLELALGHHDDLVPELETLVREHPLRERLRRHLMLALYRSGRQAEALDAYRDARRALRDELGLDPGDELQALQRAILAHDGSLAPPPRVELPSDHVPLIARRALLLRRPLVAAGLGALLLAVAATAAVLELTGGGHAQVVAVPPNSVAMIDARGSRVSSYVGVGRDPVAIAVGDGGVWVTNADDGTLSRLNPTSGRLVRTIGIGADVSGVAVGFGSVWVADGNDGTITRIDPHLNQIERTISPGGRPALAPNPIFLVAVDRRYVWVTQGDHLLRIDPSSNRVERRLAVGSPTGLAVGGGYVWVTTLSERLLRIDPGTAQLTAAQILPTQAIAPVFARGSLWLILTTSPHAQIEQIDPVSLATVAAVTEVKDPSALAAGRGFLWAADGHGNLSRVDESGAVTSTLHVGSSLSAVATGAGATWVAVTAAT